MKKKNTLVSKLTKAALLLAALAAPLTTAVAQDFNVFPITQVWSYMATLGNTTFCLDGTGWEAPGYDDSGWLTGPGGFTGGENTAATLTSLAGLLNTTTLPAPTSGMGRPQYFRTHFNLASTNGLTLVISNRIDDQAIFFINGTRVADYRHPTTQTDNCAPAGLGGDEATVWVVITLTPAQLANIIHTGDNVLAVSVHQNATGSSDMVFCSILQGTTVAPPPPVGAIAFTNGTGVITFDTLPPASQWSTRTWAGANTGITDFTGLNDAAKTNDATTITTALANVANNPPTDNNVGLWSAAGMFIGTRPTGVAYSGIMATLSNATASVINSFGIRYDFTVFSTNAPGSEQIPGQLVYYSTTGAPGSWTQLPTLSDAANDETSGTYARSADVSTTWNSHTLLYILWVDDNGNPISPDDSYQLDNVQFVTLTPTAPTFANATDPTNRTVVQCASTTLSAGFATGVPTPTYQWYRTNGTPRAIVGATNSSYTIPNMQAGDAGTYFVVAANTVLPNATSHVATVTFSAAPTFAAVKAIGSTNQTDILVSFNIPVDPATIDANGFDIDVHERGGGGSVGVASATVVSPTDVLVVAGGPMTVGVSYDVEFQNAGAGNTCTGAKVIGNVHVTASVFILQIDAQQMWRYNDSGIAPAAQGALTWTDPGWDDSAWPQGLAVLDAKRGEDRTATGITGTVVRTELVLTNAIYTLGGTQFDIPTYNFRAHLGALPYGVPNGLQAYSFFDDGGRVYINGTVAFTNRDEPTNVFGVYSAAGAISGEATYEGPFHINPSVLSAGNNVVAVEIKQSTPTSSDATMGLILVGLYDSFAPRLNASTDRNFQQTDLTWSSGILQLNTNLSRGSGWHDVPGAVSPYTVFWSPGLGAGHAGGTNTLFYRLR